MLLSPKELLDQKHAKDCPFTERIAKLQKRIEQEKEVARKNYLKTFTVAQIKEKCQLSVNWAHAVVQTIHGKVTQSDLEKLVDGAAADQKIERMKGHYALFDKDDSGMAELIAEGLAADIVWDDALEVVKSKIDEIIKGL